MERKPFVHSLRDGIAFLFRRVCRVFSPGFCDPDNHGKTRREPSDWLHADRENLRRDWDAVGDDMRRVMHKAVKGSAEDDVDRWENEGGTPS